MDEYNRFGNMMPPESYDERPYLMYRKPFKIAGNLYFVGNEWCCSHLIDTGEGLILLDTPTASGLPGLLFNIAYLGFNPKDLKIILVSHAHTDHYGCVRALVSMTGAKTYLGAVDAEDMIKNRERMLAQCKGSGPYNELFTPDVALEDGDIVELGNTRIRCVLTPGHTIGVMSHFWDLEENGKTYHVGIYGGAGFVTMSEQALKNMGLPMSMQKTFTDSIDKVWDEPVDIMLGNHPFHNDTFKKAERIGQSDANPFIDPTEWHRFFNELKERYAAFLKKTPEEVKEAYRESQWGMYYKIRE